MQRRRESVIASCPREMQRPSIFNVFEGILLDGRRKKSRLHLALGRPTKQHDGGGNRRLLPTSNVDAVNECRPRTKPVYQPHRKSL